MIFDTRQHFWHYTDDAFGWIATDRLRRDFTPEDLQATLVGPDVLIGPRRPVKDNGPYLKTLAIEARQSLEETDQLLAYAARHDFIAGFAGRVVCIGYAKADVSFQTKYFVQKELDIRGSRNAMPDDFRGVIHFIQNSGMDLTPFVTKIIKPEDAQPTLETGRPSGNSGRSRATSRSR